MIFQAQSGMGAVCQRWKGVDFMGVKVRVSKCFLPLSYLLLESPTGAEPRNAKGHLLAEEWCLWVSGGEVGVGIHLQLCDIPGGCAGLWCQLTLSLISLAGTSFLYLARHQRD